MQNLFIVDGTSGIWKSELTQYVSRYLSNATIVRKYSTRPKRQYERRAKYVTDLEFVSEAVFSSLKLEYQYMFDGHRYGFSTNDLESALRGSSRVFLIVRNLEILKRLAAKFGSVNIITVFIYTDFAEVSKRLPIESDEGLKQSIVHAFNDYLRHPESYREVIINGSTANDFIRLIDLLLKKYDGSNDELPNSPPMGHPVLFQTMMSALRATRCECDSGAKRIATLLVAGLGAFCVILWLAYVYLVRVYDWNVIEPKLSALSFPILGYSLLIGFYIITKREITLNPRTLHDNIAEHFRAHYYARHGLSTSLIAAIEANCRPADTPTA